MAVQQFGFSSHQNKLNRVLDGLSGNTSSVCYHGLQSNSSAGAKSASVKVQKFKVHAIYATLQYEKLKYLYGAGSRLTKLYIAIRRSRSRMVSACQ